MVHNVLQYGQGGLEFNLYVPLQSLMQDREHKINTFPAIGCIACCKAFLFIQARDLFVSVLRLLLKFS